MLSQSGGAVGLLGEWNGVLPQGVCAFLDREVPEGSSLPQEAEQQESEPPYHP